jgi:Na+/H+ antiporter NhaD/arsenite permease-like protein
VAIIGASTDVVYAGICASRGKSISFVTFARYGIPLTLCQLSVSAVDVLALQWFIWKYRGLRFLCRM